MDGSIRISTELDTKSFDKQIQKLESDLQQKKKRLSVLLQIQSKGLKNTDFTKEIQELEASIEKTENSLVSLNEQKKKLEETPKLNLKENFDKALKSAKRLVIGIIGVRAAYSLVRKATSAYLATDSKTTAQMEANWVGLGTIMGPVIEWLTKLMKKAVTAVLHFMSVLTGENYIAKANAAILKKQTKATNDLTKATDKYTASFDEMNVISDNNVSEGISNDVTASLFDINDLSEKTRKTIENIAKALQPVYEMLKGIVKFALEHPDIIIGLLGGATLLTMLGKIIGVAGAGTAIGTGLAGILGVLLAIASIGVIVVTIKTVTENWDKMKEEQENANKTVDSVVEQAHEMQTEHRKNVKEGKYDEKQTRKLAYATKYLVEGTLENVQANKEDYQATVQTMNKKSAFEKIVWFLTGSTQSLTKKTSQYIGVAFDELQTMTELYKQGLLNEDEIEDYKDTMILFNSVVGEGGTSISNLTKQFGISKKEAEIVQGQYNIVATELYRMYKNGDSTVNILDKMPKEVRTIIENNFDKSLTSLDNVYAMLEKIPGYKRVDIDTKVTADTSSAKSSLEKLFQGVGTITSIIDKTIGSTLSLSFKNIKLAQGGIVNNPGRGVSIGSNIIAGEAGPEAVLPLTDDTLQRLANMIPINVNVVNTMNGRVISRELQRVQNDSNFAYNR